MKKSLLLAVAGLLAAASIVSAGNREGQFSVSPIVGGYSYDSKQTIGHDSNMVYGIRAGYNFTKNIGIEALFDYVYSSKTSFPNKSAENMYRYGGELLYHLFPDNDFVPYLAIGVGGVNFSGTPDDKKAHTAFDAGVGAKYFINDSFALRGDLRWVGYDRKSDFNSNIEYTVGAYIPFGGAKPVVKPVEPPPAPAPPPPAPAPAPKVVPPPAPTASLTVSPATVTKGENATLNWKSQNATACDIQPGIGPVPPQGARQITPADSTSYKLSCTGNGGTVASAAGVTVVLPPPPKPKAAERFCDKPATIVVEFDTNKADIKTKYDEDLNKLGTFLKEWPKAKGEISGHTDNVGTAKYNLGLSQKRAASVKKYLVEKFSIAPERLTTEGYGETKPIASNKTKEGRQQNRRIETNFTCD